MSDPQDLLLRTLLEQHRITREKIENATAQMVTKDDIYKLEDKLSHKTRSNEDKFDDIKKQFAASDIIHIDLNQKISVNADWIKNVNEGIKWAIRVFVVSSLGLLGSLLPGWLNMSRNPVLPPSAAVATSAPFQTGISHH